MKYLAVLLLAAACMANVKVDEVVQAVRSEVRPGEAMDRMYRIYTTDRWFTFPKFQETAGYLKEAMTAAGLRNVEIVFPPADGVTRYGHWTMPLAWDVKQATLDIVEPDVPAGMRRLCDYQKTPASIGMWSGPTPPDGITAEVVELRSLDPAAIEKADLKGKFVMVRESTYARKLPLVKKGVVGVINGYSENPGLRDGHWWMNYWGDSGWGFTKASTPLPALSVTPRQADMISDMLARGQKVRLKAVVDSRYYPGAYPYTTAVLPGTGAQEEVLELGHTTEIGANDNATGVAAMLEAVAALNRLIESGKLPRPRRSIRVLAMPEVYGTMHYLATNPERVRKTVGAICLDTPAGPYEAAGTEYTIMLNPDAARSYTDALILRIADSYFSRLGTHRRWHWGPYTTGTDTFLSDPLIGVPTVWPYSGAGVNTHHNSEDTPDRVDPRSLRDLTAITAAYLYWLAAAGEAEVPWLAEVTASRGHENILRIAGPALEQVASAAGADELGRALYDGLERITYAGELEEEAVRSTLRLAQPAGRKKLRAALEPTAESLRRAAQDQSKRLTDAAHRRAAELGAGPAIKPLAPAGDRQLEEGARIVVKRKQIGQVTLDDLPTDKWENYPSAAWDIVPTTALYWCDGKRNLAEVIRRTRIETRAADFDFVGYFHFLAKHGYVELMETR